MRRILVGVVAALLLSVGSGAAHAADGNRVELEARVMWAKRVPANLFHLVKKSGLGVRFLHFNSGEAAFDDFFENIATPL